MLRNYPSINYYPKNSTRDWSTNPNWYIQEKMDGSQMTFYLSNNTMIFKCKNKEVDINSSCFNKAISLLSLIKDKINSNYIYYGESIQKNRHNVIEYSRIPKNYFILYDIFDISLQKYIHPNIMIEEAKRLNLEYTPTLYFNIGSDHPNVKIDELMKQIENGELLSCLGDITPEGIVFKCNCYKNAKFVGTKFKIVTEKFKERQKVRKSKEIFTPLEFLTWLGSQFNVEARFRKALQHLQERDSNITIQLIEEELDKDLIKEYSKEISTYIWEELNSYIFKAGRVGCTNFFFNYMKWIDIPTNIQKLIRKKEKNTRDSIFVEIDEFEKYYSNNKRFLKIANLIHDKGTDIKYINQLKKEEKNKTMILYQKFLLELDKDMIEIDHINIKSRLWKICIPHILLASRSHLNDWFKISNISNICENSNKNKIDDNEKNENK